MCIRFTSRSKYELSCAFGNRVKQHLSQQHFARRVSRQPNIKARNTPQIAPLIAPANVVRDCLSVPKQARESQPTLRCRLASQFPVVFSLPLFNKQTGIRCRGSARHMLVKKIVQTGFDLSGLTPMVYLQDSFALKKTFMAQQAGLARARLGGCRTSSQVNPRRR